MYLQKVISRKTFFFSFLLASWRSMTKISGSKSGSESGFISQRHGSADLDPDPYQMLWIRNTAEGLQIPNPKLYPLNSDRILSGSGTATLVTNIVPVCHSNLFFVLYVPGQVSEGAYKWDDDLGTTLQYTSGFLTGSSNTLPASSQVAPVHFRLPHR